MIVSYILDTVNPECDVVIDGKTLRTMNFKEYSAARFKRIRTIDFYYDGSVLDTIEIITEQE